MCGIREGGIREGLLVWEACVAYARVARKKRPDVLAAAGSASAMMLARQSDAVDGGGQAIPFDGHDASAGIVERHEQHWEHSHRAVARRVVGPTTATVGKVLKKRDGR